MAFVIFGKIVASSGEKKEPILMNHENIHVAQQKEKGGFFIFFFKYFWDCFKLYFKTWDVNKIYKCNKFEVEAFANENDMNYLANRTIGRYNNFTQKEKDFFNKYYNAPAKSGGRFGAIFMFIVNVAILISLIAIMIFYVI